jgi:hypothetical protein
MSWFSDDDYDKRRRARKLKEMQDNLDKKREALGITKEQSEEDQKNIISFLFPSLGNFIKQKEEEERQERERIISERRAEERHLAEIRMLNAQAMNEEVKAGEKMELVKMIKQIRKNDLASFPVELKYFVIACQAGDPTALNDIMQANVLKEYLHRKQEAEVGKMEQEMEDKKVDVENKRMNLDAKRKKL